ncbi:N-acetylneuraminate synthase [Alphaproteobacteria bacterium]|nr:N-acetylneuraminate synthase [Alphaproteobacteria bacterium]
MNIPDSKIKIIAEAGVNHNGNKDLALNLIDVASDAGADIIKFQSFSAERLVSLGAPKADYQIINTNNNESQFEMLKKLELSKKDYICLKSRCEEKGIEFLSTPFDEKNLEFLLDLGIKRIKIPSGEITNGPLILAAARSGLPLIISTGMSDIEEIRLALAVVVFGIAEPLKSKPNKNKLNRIIKSKEFKKVIKDNVILLHCTTEYPAPYSSVNLKAMNVLRDYFGTKVGYSDHTEGAVISIAAASLGAAMIEKHITLNRNFVGPDHSASIEPSELIELIKNIRIIEQSIGNGEKILQKCELKNKIIARKSLFAHKDIEKGELFSQENIIAKRPGNGVNPMDYWDLIGTKTSKDYSLGDLV